LSSKNYWIKYPLSAELYFNETSVPPFNLSLQIQNSGNYIFYAKINRKINVFKNAKNKDVYFLGIFAYFIICIKQFLKRSEYLQKINNIYKKSFRYNRQNHHKIIKTESQDIN